MGQTYSHCAVVENQIKCDVERSFWSYDHARDWSDEVLSEKRVILQDIMSTIMNRNPELEYYQGFHDICVVFVEVFDGDPALAFAVSHTLSRGFLKDFMGKDFSTVTMILPLILEILKKVDLKLHDFLSSAMTEPFFATSWLITWFSHELKDIRKVARIYDGLITSHPLFCLYLCTAIVIYFRDFIMQLQPDFADVHHFLTNIFKENEASIDFNKLIMKADRLMSALPPSRLKMLACPALKELLIQKKITLFNKPKCITRYCDSDAKQEERVKRKEKESQLQLASPLIDANVLWWVTSALTGGLIGGGGNSQNTSEDSTDSRAK